MKKTVTTLAALAALNVAVAQTEVTLRLDTKLMSNTDCNLGGDGNGGPAVVNKVYVHSGVCSTSKDARTDSLFCLQQIIPYASEVWQHVVGDWGENPQDNGKGLMVDKGNGVYELVMVLEQYYSDPNLLSQDAGANNGVVVENTPLPAGAKVYTMGMVFRNEDGSKSGRDQQGCQDIFAKDFNTANPLVINSSDNSICDFVTITKKPVSARALESAGVSNIRSFPSPFSDQLNIEFNAANPTSHGKVFATDLSGKVVATLYEGEIPQGYQAVKWNANEQNGESVKSGVYLIYVEMNGKLSKAHKVVKQ